MCGYSFDVGDVLTSAVVHEIGLNQTDGAPSFTCTVGMFSTAPLRRMGNPEFEHGCVVCVGLINVMVSCTIFADLFGRAEARQLGRW